jgi:hypothetical protein
MGEMMNNRSVLFHHQWPIGHGWWDSGKVCVNGYDMTRNLLECMLDVILLVKEESTVSSEAKKKSAFPHPSNDSIEQCPEPSCNVPKPSRTISSMSHVVPPPKKKQETLV